MVLECSSVLFHIDYDFPLQFSIFSIHLWLFFFFFFSVFLNVMIILISEFLVIFILKYWLHLRCTYVSYPQRGIWKNTEARWVPVVGRGPSLLLSRSSRVDQLSRLGSVCVCVCFRLALGAPGVQPAPLLWTCCAFDWDPLVGGGLSLVREDCSRVCLSFGGLELPSLSLHPLTDLWAWVCGGPSPRQGFVF